MRESKSSVTRFAAFADSCIYLGSFGAATKVKLINNLLVGLHIAGTAQAMAIGLKAGVDVDLMIRAVATGSGAHYLDMAKELADDVGAATPLLDCLIDVSRRAVRHPRAVDGGAHRPRNRLRGKPEDQQAPNNLGQFRDTTRQVVLWPEPYKTGAIIYPYADAKK